MPDPRIDPNYKGQKCKGCGEHLPFLLTDLCTYCEYQRATARVRQLTSKVDKSIEQGKAALFELQR